MLSFKVVVTFKEQTSTVRLAVPQDRYELQPISAHLEDLNALAAQRLKGTYKIVGLKLDGAALDKRNSLRAQAVQLGMRLEAVDLHGLCARCGQGPRRRREAATGRARGAREDARHEAEAGALVDAGAAGGGHPLDFRMLRVCIGVEVCMKQYWCWSAENMHNMQTKSGYIFLSPVITASCASSCSSSSKLINISHIC